MRFVENEDYIKEYSLEYLDYVRTLSCCVTGDRNAEPHHLEAIGMGANRKKPNIKHFTCIPICRDVHIEVHAKGINWVNERYRVQLWQEAYYTLAKWLIIRAEKKE